MPTFFYDQIHESSKPRNGQVSYASLVFLTNVCDNICIRLKA